MALTLPQLQQGLQDYLQNQEATFVSNLPLFIRQAEDRIHKAVFLPNFKNNQVGSLTAGDRFLLAPPDFLAPLSLTLINGTSYVPLLPKEVSLIYELFPVVTALATPKYYALYNESSLILGPTPDIAYQAELEYYFKPVSITVAGTSWLGNNADSCLFYAALVEAYTFMKGEKDLLQLYDMKYKEALADLKKLGARDLTDAFRADEARIANLPSEAQGSPP